MVDKRRENDSDENLRKKNETKDTSENLKTRSIEWKIEEIERSNKRRDIRQETHANEMHTKNKDYKEKKENRGEKRDGKKKILEY
jgi:hypothetical protein